MTFLVQLGLYIVLTLLSAALAPKPPKPKPAALAEFDAPRAEKGRPICVVFGEVILNDPNVLWFGDLSSKAIKKKPKKK